MIRKPEILSQQLGLKFNNPQLFTMALTHRSAGPKNNERLEFLGDSILGFIIAQELYEKFPESSEGVLSRLRANLVNQESLADLARKHSLGNFLILGSGELKSGGFRRDSILSDVMEAIMGALFKDQGYDTCRGWIVGIFKEKLEMMTLDNWQKDPKTRLQEFMQSRRLDLPEYRLVNMSGLAHAQSFQVACRISLLEGATEGSGASRKKAEQDAAEQALLKLGQNNQ